MNNILYIKNMVCFRFIKVVREELSRLGVEIFEIRLGEVTTILPTSSLPLKRFLKYYW